MVNIGESFASGIAQGMQIKMLKLKELQEKRKYEMEQKKADFDAEQNLMETVLDVTDDWLGAYRKLPMNKRPQFMQNYVNLPIFQDKNTPKWVKDYAVGMAGMSDETLKNTQSVLQMFKKGQQTKNPNLMSQAYYEGIALLDPKEAPAFQGFFDRAEDLIFGPKPSSKIDVSLQGMQKSTAGALEKDILAGQQLIAGLKKTKEKFTPEVLQFLDAPGTLKDAWIRYRRKLRLPVDEKANKEFDAWIDAGSTYLQALASKIYDFYKGSLTKTEVERARAQWPNITTDLEWKRFLSTDDGKTFLNKLDSMIEYNQAALKRLEVARGRGSVITDPVTGEIDALLDAYGQPMAVEDFIVSEPKVSKPETEKDIDLRIQLRQTYPGISKEKEDEIINKWKAR